MTTCLPHVATQPSRTAVRSVHRLLTAVVYKALCPIINWSCEFGYEKYYVPNVISKTYTFTQKIFHERFVSFSPQEQPPAIPGLKQDWASPDGAEARANLGANYQNLGQMQAFDGPAPETINGKYVSSAHYLLPPNMVDMYLLAHQSVCCLGSLPSMQLQ